MRAHERASDRAAPRLRIYPFELVALLLFVATALFLLAHRLPFNSVTLDYTLAPFVRRAPFFLALGVGLQLAYRGSASLARREIGPVRDYLSGIGNLPWLGLWLRLYLAYMLSTYVYFWVKVTIPLINEQLWDERFWRLDRLLHFGLSPNVFFVELIRDTPLAFLLDRWYAWWLLTVMAGIAFFAADRRPALRRSFILSCVLLWGVGTWIYLAFPTLGPCYVRPELFAGILEEMPGATGGQLVLWENYQKVIAARTGPLGSFNPTRGVAAMPSLHVAAHFLFALWARRFVRVLWVPFLVGTFLTFLGSVATGWHYAVDGYVALLFAWVVFRLSLRLEPLEQS